MDAKKIIIKILNTFENDSGSPNTEYDKIYLYKDGTNNKKQVTLARGFTECGGALWKVFEKYKDLTVNDAVADKLLSYRNRSCTEFLPNNKEFLELIIKTAQTDELFREAQDWVYDELYWNRGYKWFSDNGFKLPLSLGVIQDSFLQSGGMLQFLRNRFNEKTPSNGGDEKKWIKSYLDVRQQWLSTHSRKILNGTIYRTRFFLKEIERDNWNLDKFPIYPNGIRISN